MPTKSQTTLVSVILCTYNPRIDILEWALDSLDKQTLAKSKFELIVVDNNSVPPLEDDKLRQGRLVSLRLIRESRQGHIFARCAGITESKTELLVFIDDDNYLDSDYLENALKIKENEPKIGLYGGISRAVLERPIPAWKEKLLPFLAVRDYGPESITSFEDKWGEWEPIGAGMVSRRDVAEQFVHLVETTPFAGTLGRKGKNLLSHDDSLFARMANQLGYACSYQPSLKLSHFMKASRLRCLHLARTLHGHGRSYAILQRIMGKPVAKFSYFGTLIRPFLNFLSLIKPLGLRVAAIQSMWYYGFTHETRKTD
jgi:glycosyltransferase involved in cell wall biosynthesis